MTLHDLDGDAIDVEEASTSKGTSFCQTGTCGRRRKKPTQPDLTTNDYSYVLFPEDTTVARPPVQVHAAMLLAGDENYRMGNPPTAAGIHEERRWYHFRWRFLCEDTEADATCCEDAW
ncbi:unnamed protein product [Amoebophrya sp. A120]|nr:unnamed protein product [Amoebophrya sp. A120]|eukprot:GSA120T00018226001.1